MDVDNTLHIECDAVKKHLLTGNFGLEKESLRLTQEGFMSHTLHPFPNNNHIVRDFCENQTEINTSVATSAQNAIDLLTAHTREIQKTLVQLPEPELLWPFSNPAYIRNEADIPVAQFSGGYASKTDYREYLSNRYGRYKMVLSGIHINYSFSDALLQADFGVSGYDIPVLALIVRNATGTVMSNVTRSGQASCNSFKILPCSHSTNAIPSLTQLRSSCTSNEITGYLLRCVSNVSSFAIARCSNSDRESHERS